MSPSSIPPSLPPIKVGDPAPSQADQELITYLTQIYRLMGMCLPSQFNPNANPMDYQEDAVNLCTYLSTLEQLMKSSPGSFPGDVQQKVKTLISSLTSLLSSSTAPTPATTQAITDEIEALFKELGTSSSGWIYNVAKPTQTDGAAGLSLLTEWEINYAYEWNTAPVTANEVSLIAWAAGTAAAFLQEIGNPQYSTLLSLATSFGKNPSAQNKNALQQEIVNIIKQYLPS